MTSLLEKLPEEMVERILKLYVKDVGAVPAWKNQLVCHQFSRVIKHEVLARQPIQAFKRLALKGGPGRTILKNNVSLYLQLRVDALHGAEPYMPGFIGQMVHVLSQGATDSDKLLKAAHVKILCDVMAKQCQRVVYLITMDHRSPSAQLHIYNWSDTATGNKTAAAAALGNKQALAAYVGSDLDTLWKQSPAFGYPLSAATYSGQTAIVRAIIEYFQANPPKKLTEDHRSATLSAIIRSLETRDYKLTQLLVQFCSKYFLPIVLKDIKDILCTAIGSGNAEIVLLVLSLKHRGGKDLYAQGYSLACRLGHTRVASQFIESGLLAFDQPVGRHGCPFEMAVRSGNVAAAKELLDLGVNVNGTFLPGNPAHDSALHHAASAKNADMVRMLLKAGASPYLVGKYGQDLERSNRSFWEIDGLLDNAVYNQVQGSFNKSTFNRDRDE